MAAALFVSRISLVFVFFGVHLPHIIQLVFNCPAGLAFFLTCTYHLLFECFNDISKALLSVQNAFGAFCCAPTMCSFLLWFLIGFSVSKVFWGCTKALKWYLQVGLVWCGFLFFFVCTLCGDFEHPARSAFFGKHLPCALFFGKVSGVNSVLSLTWFLFLKVLPLRLFFLVWWFVLFLFFLVSNIS